MGVFRGTGTQFLRGDAASPEVFTAVGDVISISGPSIVKDEIEVTALDSTAKEFISDLDNPGEAFAGTEHELPGRAAGAAAFGCRGQHPAQLSRRVG